MDAYIWRTTTGNKYVCSYTGSDLYGNGTQTNPFKTLTAAYWYGSIGGTIVCRGIFNDNPTKASWVSSVPYYGNNASIVGDYYGAAIWDGQNTEFLYGYFMSRMIVLNSTSSGGFVGLGAASGAGDVGNVYRVSGLAGSPALIDNSVAYWGVLGGTSAVSKVVFSRMKKNINYLVSLGGIDPATMENNTYHDADKSIVTKRFTSGYCEIRYGLFTKFAIYLNQAITFNMCMFNSECTFWVDNTQFVPTGAVDAAKMQSLVDKVTSMTGSKIVLIDCKYTSQVSEAIYNNHLKLDFSLKTTSDAGSGTFYYGAIKPAINVGIFNVSDGIVACWDNRTAVGDIVIANNSINIDNSPPYSAVSSIISKIVTINTDLMILDEFKALFKPIFNQNYYLGDKKMVSDTKIYAGTILSVGRYIVVGGTIQYGTEGVNENNTVNVTATGTTFSSTGGEVYLLEIIDPNIYNPVHVRVSPFIYGVISANEIGVGAALKAGVTYLNIGANNITLNTGLPSERILVPEESFIAEAGNTWTATAGYQMGIMFDDDPVVGNRIVPSAPWMSALSFDSFFNYTNNGNQVYDTEDDTIHGGKRLMSSGNPKAYKSPYVGVYANQYLNKTYMQFKIILRKWNL